LDKSNARYEARRCLSYANCFECDLGYCRGCGICAQECPCGSIAMVPQEI